MLLTETELRAALEPLLDRLLTERLRLFRLELEPRLQTIVSTALEPRSTSDLEAGLARMRKAEGPGACFTALFEVSESWVGRQRTLLVAQGNRVAVWKNTGTNLPKQFSLDRRSDVLPSGTAIEVRVRGELIGLLHWPGEALPPSAATKLELVIAWTEMRLLEQAMGRKRAAASAMGEIAPIPVEPRTGSPGGSPAARFAALLMDDLKLYLERERASELAAGRENGDWRTRFAPEVERCRRTFAERYGAGDEAVMQVFEEATPRLVE